ncbi:hypothetical protein CRE_18692 [Caenorhabditis remanei]|uniref:Uncharacterized protein n=1 Tax=Caenorhabditis remanei TaxID=31234 RepID=E3LL62_CAERE|nr:hypothetical protein CRE_18692 [Caenorhabditis remanei]
MIYVNWYHHNMPKIFGILSYIINPLFIYMVVTKSRSQMGNYRYLLIGFAVFDMIYSTAELLTPIASYKICRAVLNSGYGFVTFITEGPFFEHSDYGLHAISSRRCFVSMSYAVLIIHFVYRYLILFYPHHVDKMLKPLGIIVMFLFLIAHGAFWTWICEDCLAPNEEIRDIIRPAFLEVHHVDSDHISLLTGQYRNASDYVVYKSWIGITALTLFSMYLHDSIFRVGLQNNEKNEGKLQHDESECQSEPSTFQSTCCSNLYSDVCKFSTNYYCLVCSNIFDQLDMVGNLSKTPKEICFRWNNYVCNIALSAFPLIDPIVVIYFIPNYKNTLLIWCKLRKPKVVTITTSMISAPIAVFYLTPPSTNGLHRDFHSFDYYNQFGYTMIFITIALHGINSTLILLWVHHPYREVFNSLIFLKD